MNYVNRWRHKKGFGVQSPFAFHLVQDVINEGLPFYAYKQLEAVRNAASGEGFHFYSQKNYRLLFRLTNYWRPGSMAEVGSEGGFMGALSMSLAKPSSPCLCLSDNEKGIKAATDLFLRNPLNRYVECADCDSLLAELRSLPELGLLHIANTAHCDLVLQTALSAATKRTLIVIEGLRRSPEVLDCWQGAAEDERVSLSFDLGNIGLLFFNQAYFKQHYELIY